MHIISHRGYWKLQTEKNTKQAFRRSFELEFGTETDVRDFCERLVISHDPPTDNKMLFETFLQIYSEYSQKPTLALNIKADGLQEMLKKCLDRFGVRDYFVFDMSVPDLIGYSKAGIPFFTRVSEYEREPVLLNESAGVWLDAFMDDWYSDDTVRSFLAAGKRVCIVSPELHRRVYQPLWNRLKELDREASGRLMLCTDLPEEARYFFAKTTQENAFI